VDGRKARGDRTRSRILELAAEQATLEGLGGLSLSQLSDALHLSKSGVHSLFGTKQDLQLETIAAARRRFITVVVLPVWDQDAGLPRLRALVASWLSYVRVREFPGGCFVARWTPEFTNQPGRVRDALISAKREWLAALAGEITFAIERGQLAASTDPKQLAFEIDALLAAGNNDSLLGDDEALDRTALGVSRLLERELERK
jgi:AcrR family transcriptional regulator